MSDRRIQTEELTGKDTGRQTEERVGIFCKMAERETEARTDRYEGLVKQNVDSQVSRKYLEKIQTDKNSQKGVRSETNRMLNRHEQEIVSLQELRIGVLPYTFIND